MAVYIMVIVKEHHSLQLCSILQAEVLLHVPKHGRKEDHHHRVCLGGPEGAPPGPTLPYRRLQVIVASSKVKLVMVVDSSNTALQNICSVFQKMLNSCTAVICNPFYNSGDLIQSRTFDSVMVAMMIRVC
uniref:Uncharacterized protein n=1 Tax=Sciurus vulgaris TaxID=55149 RepID=A0A8D2AI44_SCIVU